MIFWLLFSLFKVNDIQSQSSVGPNYIYAQDDSYNNGFKKERYEYLLQKIKEIYTPIIEERGGSFAILQDWSDGAVNMWAWRWGQEYWLEIPGGMARYHLINEEAFLLSICHELGHLLGGAPGSDTISYEGQSDYFASLQCMKIILPKIRQEKKIPVQEAVKTQCKNLNHVRIEDCQRTLLGALSLTSYYAELEKTTAPSLNKISQIEVKTTLTKHPPSQCRLDSFLAGLICAKDPKIVLDFKDPNVGSCKGKELGKRPRCWYQAKP